MTDSLEAILGAIWTGNSLTRDFNAICDFGGRLAGSPSEFAAQAYLDERLNEIPGTRADYSFEYSGMAPGEATLALSASGDENSVLDVVALPGTPPLPARVLEVMDLGMGTEMDFEAAGQDIVGKAVMVRHEYPFSTGHTHRRYKYDWACRAGAAAFLIANNNPMGGVVTGGSGTGSSQDIPAVGISYSAAEAIRRAVSAGRGRISLSVDSRRDSWTARNLILDVPGGSDDRVVLCAHIDGHNLAESAMDNATGLATVLEVGRRLAPIVSSLGCGLTLAMFTVEEWGLEGSRRYVQQMSAAERARIRAAIALDSITGHPRLAALTGGDSRIERLLVSCAESTGVPIDVVRPKLANSDHYSFQEAGIPAMRLIAGYGREESLTRYLLTPADNRSMVEPSQLKAAALATATLVYEACRGSF